MQILLNGQDRDLPPGTTLGALLLAAEGLGERRVAVEVNRARLPCRARPARDARPCRASSFPASSVPLDSGWVGD